MFRCIQHVQALPDYRVRLLYEGEAPVVVDFRPVVEEGGVFAPLADVAFFGRVRVGERGRSISWPGQIDFCSDALWLQSRPEASQAETFPSRC